MEIQVIQNKIHEIRGQRVMLDFDLAEMYEVETKVLKQSVKRNLNRFPKDFMFELSQKKFESLRSQIVTSNRGGTRYLPYAFTEQGVAMLSTVLRSYKAIEVNINIIRAFVLMRQHLSDYKELKEKIEKIETEMNVKFQDIYQAINYLMQKDHQGIEQKERKRIAFK